MNNNLEKYYEYTHRANVAMCRLNNDLAFKLFDSAFAYKKYPFATDLNNAVYTGIHSSRPDGGKLRHYLHLMRSKGIDLREKYRNLPGHLHHVHRMGDGTGSDPSLIDSYYASRVKNAIASDQVLREFSYAQFGHPYDYSLLPAIDKIDSMNYILMDSIFRHALKMDIPLEQLLGMEANGDLEIIYMHNASWGRYNKDLTDSLIAGGLIDARQYAYFYDGNCNGFYSLSEREHIKWDKEFGCDPFYGIYGTHIVYQYDDGTAFIPLLEPGELEIVNQNRKALFLGDVYEEARLKIFTYRNSGQGVESPLKSIFSANTREMTEFEDHLLEWRSGYFKYDHTDSFIFDQPPVTK